MKNKNRGNKKRPAQQPRQGAPAHRQQGKGVKNNSVPKQGQRASVPPQGQRNPAPPQAKRGSAPKGRAMPDNRRKPNPKPIKRNKKELKKPVQAAPDIMQRPTAPVTREQKRAYSKTVKNRDRKSKRRGSRGGNYILYYILAAVIAIAVFIVLARTVLFNCSSIEVEGNARYTAEEIIRTSGLAIGESLLSIDEAAAEQRIVSSLAYIDMAEVTKSFPTKIKIKVTEAEKWYCVQHGGRPYIISRMGKIIEESAGTGLPVILGYEPLEPMVGRALESETEGKTDIPAAVLNAAEAAGVRDITSIDITDRFEIKVLVEDRITLELGNSTELENKMHIAEELIDSEISATESVTVNLTNTEKVYVRDNNIIENPVVVPILPESETAEGTGEAETSETAETAEAAV